MSHTVCVVFGEIKRMSVQNDMNLRLKIISEKVFYFLWFGPENLMLWNTAYNTAERKLVGVSKLLEYRISGLRK